MRWTAADWKSGGFKDSSLYFDKFDTLSSLFFITAFAQQNCLDGHLNKGIIQKLLAIQKMMEFHWNYFIYGNECASNEIGDNTAQPQYSPLVIMLDIIFGFPHDIAGIDCSYNNK